MKTEDFETMILQDMLHHKIIGEKHTSTTNLLKGYEKHLRGEVKKAVQNLIRKGYIKIKPTSYGVQASLNTERLEEIHEIIFQSNRFN